MQNHFPSASRLTSNNLEDLHKIKTRKKEVAKRYTEKDVIDTINFLKDFNIKITKGDIPKEIKTKADLILYRDKKVRSYLDSIY